MSLREQIRESLDKRMIHSLENRGYKVVGEYVSKIKPIDVQDDATLWDASRDLSDHLKACGLTKGQRAGVRHILSECGFVVYRDFQGKVVDRHTVTVGEIRHNTDEEIKKLVRVKSDKTVSVLRALFGRKDD